MQPLIHVDNWYGYAQGKLAVDSAQASFAQARHDLIVRLGQACFDALAAQDNLAIARSQKALFAQQLESSQTFARGCGCGLLSLNKPFPRHFSETSYHFANSTLSRCSDLFSGAM
jgi:Outer membrane efflux protein